MAGEDIREMDKKYNLHSWAAQGALNPIVVDKAEGIFFWDADGKKYYDMSAQLVNMNVGHGNKKIIKAIQDQAEKMPFMGPGYAVDVRSQLARTIVEEVAPKNMGKVFLTLGGAEANENAIKIARMVTGKNKVFSRYRSYHGATYGAANLTGEPRRFPSEPGIPGFVKFFDPYLYREPKQAKFENEEAYGQYCLDKLEEQIIWEGENNVAAIFLETVTGSNGVLIPPKGYMAGVRALCDKYGIMMVCDEVMAGWGRTGEWFAINNWNVEPDMITFAKGLTCGYAPIGGVIVSKKIAKHFDENVLYCGLTYSAHLLGCAAGLATIEVYKELDLINRSKEMGKVLAKEMAALRAKHPCVGECRNIGLFGMVEFVKNASEEPMVPYGKDPEGKMKKILGKLRENGFTTYSHENMIAVSPPLIITEQEMHEAFEILDKVCSWVDENLMD